VSEILALRQKLDRFGNIGEEFGRLVQSQPEGWRRNHIAIRRDLQATIADLGATGRRILAERGDPAKLREFENLHAHYRRVVSLHQADWPVVIIDPENPDYLRSREEASDAYLEFVKALEQMCA